MSKHIIGNDRISTTSNTARTAAGLLRRLLIRKPLLGFALPLTLLVGCASGPHGPAGYTELGPPLAPPALTALQTEDRVIAHEIFRMILADKGINYALSASVHNGAVSLSGTSSDGAERQRIVDGMWGLAGVNQVKNEQGVNVAPTVPVKAVAVR